MEHARLLLNRIGTILYKVWCFAFQHKMFIIVFFMNLGALASLLGVIISIKPDAGITMPLKVLITISIALFVIVTIIEYISARRRHVFVKGNDDKWKEHVRRYMHRWIKKTDRVVVFSRDLSWVDENMERLLVAKALRKELTVCLPTQTPLTEKLQKNNASILTYSSLGYDLPKSRFTIAGYGKGGASVAIAHSSSKYHVIEECSENDHPAFSMAEDLIEILKGVESNR